MYTRLVCSGGAFKGFAILGALGSCEQLGILPSIEYYLGCSAGSIICYLLSLSYSVTEIFTLLQRAVLSSTLNVLDIEDILTFFTDYGLDNGDYLRCILIDALSAKYPDLLDVTFATLHQLTKKQLIVSGANLSLQSLEFFSVTSTPDMSVITAVLISTCVPLLYKPILHNDHYYCDGVIYSNFPCTYFSTHKGETLGINVSVETSGYRQIAGFGDYLRTLIMSVLERVTTLSCQDVSSYTVCNINITEKKSFFDVSKLEFAISHETVTEYYSIGEATFANFYEQLTASS